MRSSSDTQNPSDASSRTKPSRPRPTRSPTTQPPGSPAMTTTPTSMKAIPSSRFPKAMPGLPGAGYEALHPELKGLDPEDYPDIHKMAILADVAPYSREYNQVSPSCRTQKPSRGRDEPQPPTSSGLTFSRARSSCSWKTSSAWSLCPGAHKIFARWKQRP